MCWRTLMLSDAWSGQHFPYRLAPFSHSRQSTGVPNRTQFKCCTVLYTSRQPDRRGRRHAESIDSLDRVLRTRIHLRTPHACPPFAATHISHLHCIRSIYPTSESIRYGIYTIHTVACRSLTYSYSMSLTDCVVKTVCSVLSLICLNL